MEAYVLGTVDADGLEGAETYVEREVRDFNATCSEGFKYLRREVQASGWSSGRASLTCKDGLIAGAVFRSIGFGFGAVNVRRQW